MQAAFVDRARTVRQALPAFERAAYGRVSLEALEFIVRRKVRILIVEMHDESDRDQLVLEVIEERSAAGRVVERPALAVKHQARPMLVRRDLPQLLDADAVLLRIDAVAQVEFRHQLLRQRAAASFREQRVFRAQLHAGLIVGLVRSVFGDAHVAGGNTEHRAAALRRVVQNLGRGESRVDLDTERFRLLREPSTQIPEADDVVAMVAHQRRQEPVRDAVCLVRRKHHEPVFGDRRFQRSAPGLPIRNKLVDRFGIDHRAGQDVRADLGAFFEHANADFALGLRGELLQSDRRRQPGRTAADDDHVVLHDFARHCQAPGGFCLSAVERPL